jgi:uncharacterized protein YdhG (YjbR/CyaY superfamily)
MKETIGKIRQEVENLEKSAERLKKLSYDMPAIKRNVEVILTFIYILKFITPRSQA